MITIRVIYILQHNKCVVSKCTTTSTSNHCTKFGCSRKASMKQEKLVAWTQRWVSGDVKEKMGETGNLMDEKEGNEVFVFGRI